MYIMAKAAGDACNLSCRYCYYLGTGESLYPGKGRVMSDDTLHAFVKHYIESATEPDVLFTWHGGEPLLRPLAFYRRAVELQRFYADGRHIDNALQTNGTLITPEWAHFLASEGWLTGVSIDGPEDMHDAFRGKGSHARVVQGIKLLEEAGAEWNAMAVATRLTASRPLEFYRYLRDVLGCRYIQFTPETETDCAISPEEWGGMLCAIFDEWVRRDVGEVFVQIFDATLAGWVGAVPGVCSMARTCGHAAALEWNGDLYSCDHFVDARHRLGNIHSQTIYEMMTSPQQQSFGRAKRDGLPQSCLQCPWHHLCHGGCPKDRDARGRNILCAGFARFFAHSRGKMLAMARLLSEGRDACEVMRS